MIITSTFMPLLLILLLFLTPTLIAGNSFLADNGKYSDIISSMPATDSRHKLPYCNPFNLRLVNGSEGEFYLQEDGTLQFDFLHCQLRRFTTSMAAKCLRGTHLVFMGDAVSRYFYISLAYLFSQQTWSPKFSQLPNHPNQTAKSIFNEKDFHSWSLFFHHSNQILSSGVSGAKNEKEVSEVCDCYRNDSRPWYANPPTPHQQLNCIENRHFRYAPGGNWNDQENDVRLSYIQWYGHMPMRGHRELSLLPRDASYWPYIQRLNERLCAHPTQANTVFPFVPLATECATTRSDIGKYNFPTSFCYAKDCVGFPNQTSPRCQGFEHAILQPLGTTHLILNVGWHSGLNRFDPPFLTKVLDAAEKYFAHPGPNPSSNPNPNLTNPSYPTSPASTSKTTQAIIGPEQMKKVSRDTAINRKLSAQKPNPHPPAHSGGHNHPHGSSGHHHHTTSAYPPSITKLLAQKHSSSGDTPSSTTGYWGNIYLPKVTWRASTFDATFRIHDRLALQHHHNLGPEIFEYFAVYDLTKRLRHIHHWIETKDNEKLAAHIKISGVNVKAKVEELGGLGQLANWMEKPYLDKTFFEPWVYTEINTIFLNAICPE